jgi:hypothetical protein
MAFSESVTRRLRMATAHFGASALVGAIASLLIFKIWYPAPFAGISGALSLFTLLVSVDVVLGPALTAVVANPGKPARVFVRDLVVIVCLQLAAFAYGIHTIALARPVAVVFEVDLLRVVSAAEIEPGAEAKAPPPLNKLSWAGPVLMAAALPPEGAEKLKAIELGLAGIHLAMQPAYWREYASQTGAAWKAARPAAKLLSQYPGSAAELQRIAGSAGVAVDALRFLPVTSRHADWVALLATPESRVVGYLPLDGFF